MLKKKMIANIRKTMKRAEKSSDSDSNNSFLVEVTYVDEVSRQIRDKIESRFRKSKVNTSYIFPRQPLSKNQSNKIVPQNRHTLSSTVYPSDKKAAVKLKVNTSLLTRTKYSKTPILSRINKFRTHKNSPAKNLPYEDSSGVSKMNSHFSSKNSRCRCR